MDSTSACTADLRQIFATESQKRISVHRQLASEERIKQQQRRLALEEVEKTRETEGVTLNTNSNRNEGTEEQNGVRKSELTSVAASYLLESKVGYMPTISPLKTTANMAETLIFNPSRSYVLSPNVGLNPSSHPSATPSKTESETSSPMLSQPQQTSKGAPQTMPQRGRQRTSPALSSSSAPTATSIRRKKEHQLISRTMQTGKPTTSSNAVPATDTSSPSAPSASLTKCNLRDIVIFASKQIFERGFEARDSCYFDFGLDSTELSTLANLFNDVDGDKDGRLGINDIANWVSSLGGSMDSEAAAEAIKSVKPEGGFLSKLDFVRLIIEREMASEEGEMGRGRGGGGGGAGGIGETESRVENHEEKISIKSEDLLWATFIALDANRDGWISVEDFRRLYRSLDHELSDLDVASISGSGANGTGPFNSGPGANGNGSINSGFGIGGVAMNFPEFKTFIEWGRGKSKRKRKFCVIQ